jgi:uncharacterized integral membrane protein (TIGR00698 family)
MGLRTEPLGQEGTEPATVGALQEAAKPPPFAKVKAMIGGLAFTFAIAVIGDGLAQLPVLHPIGPMACAILTAVLYRQTAGYPNLLRAGIQFSAKRLLRIAIILFGLRLNVEIILHQGLGLLVRDATTIAFAMTAMWLVARWMRADKTLSLLLGVGTGVCGAAAIAAVSPIVNAKDEDTAVGTGMIALTGTVFGIAYTLLRPHLPLPAVTYGVWCGVSLHEIAHVALAAAPAGSNALAVALLAKLGRVFLLVPLSFLLLVWRQCKGTAHAGARVEFPWFLLGFIAMSLIGTFGTGRIPLLNSHTLSNIATLSTFLLTMAMVGLGLNVSFSNLRAKALRPLAALLCTSMLLSGVTLATVW